MSLGKKDIILDISTKAQISRHTSKLLFDKFIGIIKHQSKSKIIKISNFGTFNKHISPERVGRNPKTKDSYIISKRAKLSFKSSKSIKNILN